MELTNEQIALKQGISKRTVETHMTHAYRFLRIEVKKSGETFYFHIILHFMNNPERIGSLLYSKTTRGINSG